MPLEFEKSNDNIGTSDCTGCVIACSIWCGADCLLVCGLCAAIINSIISAGPGVGLSALLSYGMDAGFCK